jgi:CubicO group peptidase (beta-lactamase class C family)
MREQMFDPLGMRNTAPDPAVAPDDDFPPVNLIRELIYDPRARRGSTSDPATRLVDGHVTSYYPRFASDPQYGMHVMRPLDYSCYGGAGSFVSTPSDLVRFALAMQGGKLLHPDTVKLLQTSQRLATGEETGHGLGWYNRTAAIAGKDRNVIGQDGNALGGMVASLITIPENDIAVAVTSNISHADTYSIALNIAGSFLDQGSRKY